MKPLSARGSKLAKLRVNLRRKSLGFSQTDGPITQGKSPPNHVDTPLRAHVQ